MVRAAVVRVTTESDRRRVRDNLDRSSGDDSVGRNVRENGPCCWRCGMLEGLVGAS